MKRQEKMRQVEEEEDKSEIMNFSFGKIEEEGKETEERKKEM